MKQIGHNLGWQQPQDDDKAADYERELERGDYLRDDRIDRELERLAAEKEEQP